MRILKTNKLFIIFDFFKVRLSSFYLSIIIFLFTSVGFTIYAQKQEKQEKLEIRGIIVNDQQIPLSHTLIKVQKIKGPFSSLLTDEKGAYLMWVELGDEFIFQIEGFEDQLIKIEDPKKDRMDLVFTSHNFVYANSNTLLKEVIVKGALGRDLNKHKIGYSIEEIDAMQFNQGRPINSLNAISGRVGGVQISYALANLGGSTRFIIRGENSINGNNKPLIVVDGIPIDNTNHNDPETDKGLRGIDWGDPIADIDPKEIDHISVLKGGASSALYGSRAVNGAVIITTKKLKQEKTNIVIHSGFFFTQVYNFPRLQKKYGGGEPSTFHGDSLSSIGQFKTYKGFNVVDSCLLSSWGPKYDPSIKYLPWDALYSDQLQAIPYTSPKYDVEHLFKIAPSYTNSFLFEKKVKETSIRAFLSHLKQEGLLPNSHMERINFSLSTSAKVYEGLHLNTHFKYIHNRGFNKPDLGFDGDMLFVFMQGQRQLDWRRLSNYEHVDKMQRSPFRRNFQSNEIIEDNLYWNQYKNYSNMNRDNFIGSTSLNYKIIEGLTLEGKIMGNIYYNISKMRRAIGSSNPSSYRESKINLSDFNYEAILNYQKRWSEKINSSSFLRVNRWNYKLNKFDISTGELRIPDVFSFTNTLEGPFVFESTHKKRINALSANINIGFENFIFLDIAATNDWSSTLPIKNSSYFYPATSLSWLFSKHIKKLKWLSLGKLRISCSQVGSDINVETYQNQIEKYYFLGDSFKGKGTSYIPLIKFNPDLYPEKQNSWELAGEFNLFKNRINTELIYYHKAVKNQILPISVPFSTGYMQRWENIGKLENKGVELHVSCIPIRDKWFHWKLDLNVSKNINKVVDLGDLDKIRIEKTFVGPHLFAIKGKSAKEFMGIDFMYAPNGKRLIDQEGHYIPSNFKPLGSIFPDYKIGIFNTFSYKNMEFSFLIDIQKGGKFYSYTYARGMLTGLHEDSAKGDEREKGIILDGVVKVDEHTYVENKKRISLKNHISKSVGVIDALSIFDASYIKLRNITVGYNIDVRKKQNIPFKSIKVSLFGTNLFVWGPAARKGLDPEAAIMGNSNIQGIEVGTLPMARIYGFDIQLNF